MFFKPKKLNVDTLAFWGKNDVSVLLPSFDERKHDLRNLDYGFWIFSKSQVDETNFWNLTLSWSYLLIIFPSIFLIESAFNVLDLALTLSLLHECLNIDILRLLFLLFYFPFLITKFIDFVSI